MGVPWSLPPSLSDVPGYCMSSFQHVWANLRFGGVTLGWFWLYWKVLIGNLRLISLWSIAVQMSLTFDDFNVYKHTRTVHQVRWNTFSWKGWAMETKQFCYLPAVSQDSKFFSFPLEKGSVFVPEHQVSQLFSFLSIFVQPGVAFHVNVGLRSSFHTLFAKTNLLKAILARCHS